LLSAGFANVLVAIDVMIPMRDGVKLYTVILVPNGALGKKTAPILMTRTPYDATALTSHAPIFSISKMVGSSWRLLSENLRSTPHVKPESSDA